MKYKYSGKADFGRNRLREMIDFNVERAGSSMTGKRGRVRWERYMMRADWLCGEMLKL